MTKQAELKKQAYEGDLKSRPLSVLIYLIDRSDRDLTCFPAISTMAKQLHISVSTVKRALSELIKSGYIAREPRYRENNGQTSNLYTLILNINKKSDDCLNDENICIKESMPVEYITFETIKEKQILPDSATENDMVEVAGMENNLLLNKVPKVQTFIFIKTRRILFCISYKYAGISERYFIWTGGEVILRPP